MTSVLKYLRLIMLVVISLYLGISLLFNPEELSDFMIRVIGIYFLIEGIDYIVKIIGLYIENKLNDLK